MRAMVVEVGAWRASVHLGVVSFEFEDSDRLLERDFATRPAVDERSAVVEIRRIAGGMNPWALLSGRFVHDRTEWFSIVVPHSGAFPDACRSTSVGNLGRRLCVGLPEEFAQAVVDGLVRFEPENRPAGRLEVAGGGFDLVDSSESIFEVAGGLLKWALLADDVTESTVTQFVTKLAIGT